MVNIKNLIIFLQIIVLNFILLGCLNTKVKNCQQIIKITVEVEKKVQENFNSQNPDNILKVADSFENASQQILSQKIADQHLANYSNNLGKIYHNYGEVTRNFIVAFKNKDQEKAIFYQDEVKKLFTQQQELVQQINNYCQ
jgi:mevalonate kinase